MNFRSYPSTLFVSAFLIALAAIDQVQAQAPTPVQASEQQTATVDAASAAEQLAAPDTTWWHDHPAAPEDERWVPGHGLEFESRDGLFALAIRLRAQILYQVERGYDLEASSYDDPRQNLTLRRARIVFAGHMWGEKTQYKVELAVAPADLGMEKLAGNNPPISNGDNYLSRSPLLDWYLQFSQIRDLNLRIGQYKVPYSRERVVSSGDLQFVDRTLLNQEFNLDRDIGFDVRSKDLFGWRNRLRFYLGIFNGDGHSQYELNDFGLMYLARAEFLPLGKFDDYTQGDLGRTRRPGISIGAAYARIENAVGSRGILGSRPRDGGTTDYDNVTADLTFRYAGLSLESVYFWRQGRRHAGGAVDDEGVPVAVQAPRAGWGSGLQAGYLLPFTNLEVSGRYSAVRQVGASAQSSLRDGDELAAAISFYFARHAYKLQGDWSRLWGEGIAGSGTAFDEGRDLYRAQLQAAF